MSSKLNGHRNIYDIVKKEKLDIVNQPISKAHGLPNECYNSKEYTGIERRKIFEDKWVVVGVASSIPKPGDAKPFDLLGIPLILLRTKNNKIKVDVCAEFLLNIKEIERIEEKWYNAKGVILACELIDLAHNHGNQLEKYVGHSNS